MKRRLPSFACTLLLLAVSRWCQSHAASAPAPNNYARWEPEIAAFETADRTNHPPVGCNLFVGSSSIRLWSTLKDDFPDLPVINRGFGGSELADAVYFADRIIKPYLPREVVIYAGANDLANAKTPEIAFGDFITLVGEIRAKLPRTAIAFIASAPNPKRWANVSNIKKFNTLAQTYCVEHGLAFIDVFSQMLGPDGLPRPDIFQEDRLHMNAKGYEIWKRAVRPYLK